MSFMTCCVPDCLVRYVDGGILHRFPNPKTNYERFHTWVTRVGGELLSLDQSYVARNKRICHKHFHHKYYGSKNKLFRIAVPTLYMPVSPKSPPKKRDASPSLSDQKDEACGTTEDAPPEKRPRNTEDCQLGISSTSNDAESAPPETSAGDHVGCQPRISSPLTVAQSEILQNFDLDQDQNEECCTICEPVEQFEEGIVPEAKFFSWQKKKEAIPIQAEIVADIPDNLDDIPDIVDDIPDNVSLYCDDEDPTLPQNEKSNIDKTLHEGYLCDECKGEIRGFRYTCVQCSDLDLCSACETNRAHAHHYVLRVPEPRPYTEIHSVLATVRRYIMNKQLDPITQLEQADDAISIKSEINSDIEDDEMRDKTVDLHWPDSSNKSTLHNQYECVDEVFDVDFDQGSQSNEVSNTQVEEQNDPLSTETVGLSQSVQQQQQQSDTQDNTPPVPSKVKKKIIYDFDEFIKAEEHAVAAKKLLRAASKKALNIKIQNLINKGQFKSGNKVMLLKLPAYRQYKATTKDPIVVLPPNKDTRNSANLDNGYQQL